MLEIFPVLSALSGTHNFSSEKHVYVKEIVVEGVTEVVSFCLQLSDNGSPQVLEVVFAESVPYHQGRVQFDQLLQCVLIEAVCKAQSPEYITIELFACRPQMYL